MTTAMMIEPRPSPRDPCGVPVVLLEDGQRAPLRTCHEDGTVHLSDLKRIDVSGKHYLHACNVPLEPTRDMLIGTAVHNFVLGARQGAKELLLFDGKSRQGNAWKDFRAAHPDAEILTTPEWDEAQDIAAALQEHPLVIDRFAGARFEVALEWEERVGDRVIKCSTSGVDVLCADALGDLKCTRAKIHRFERHAFEFHYPQQLAFYRRGAQANGLDVSKGVFLLGAELGAPHDCVDLELTEGLIAYADRAVQRWLDKLAALLDCVPEPRRVTDWPGVAQSPRAFDLPVYLREELEDDGEGEELDA